MPQERCYGDPARAWKTFPVLQIKNIKLHIVTDIKVNFNSMLGFRISSFGWGEGIKNAQINVRHNVSSHFQVYPGPGPSLACLACLACLVFALVTKT